METTIQLFNEVSLSYDADGNANIADSRTVLLKYVQSVVMNFTKQLSTGLKGIKDVQGFLC